MTQTKKVQLTAEVGEEIGKELGIQFISSYRVVNPTDTVSYYIGRNILDQILAQPGCVGINFYNAYNEEGQKNLVYVGVNGEGKDMLQITTINTLGQLESIKGIVADRSLPPQLPPQTGGFDWWSFE